MRHSVVFLLLALIALGASTLTADAGVIASLGSPDVDDLQVLGFELERPMQIDIEAVGILEQDDVPFGLRWLVNIDRGDDRAAAMSVAGWLIDSETRETVWSIVPDDTYSLGGELRGIEDELRLEPGRYELYLASTHGWARHAANEALDDEPDDRTWWQRMMPDGRRKLDELRDDLVKCHITLSSAEVGRTQIEQFTPTGELPGALLSVNRLGDSSFEIHGIQVDTATRVGLYGVMEHLRGDREPSDFGWIVDESSREIVWHASNANSRAGGGAAKNRVVDDELDLEPGRFLLYVGTDDSHSYEAFNAPPPHDPLNWGLTLRAVDGTVRQAVSFLDPAPPRAAVIDFTEAGDGLFREQPFRMKRDGTVHMRALGEFIERDDHFADGAWIVDDAGLTVWNMNERNSMPAGGAEKNRLVDSLVSLQRGDYVLYWTSDGSHSFEGWNAATPFEPAAWGVALRPAGETIAGDIELIDADEMGLDARVLATISRVGDDEFRREQFTLDGPTRVEIYAMGEGAVGEMHDYPTIRDDRGQVFWEMTYRESGHAGGAEKNRMIRTVLTLDAGTWTVEYRSDDSHSFREWNASPPRNPLGWGITVRREK